jgi:hypothetical protein
MLIHSATSGSVIALPSNLKASPLEISFRWRMAVRIRLTRAP